MKRKAQFHEEIDVLKAIVPKIPWITQFRWDAEMQILTVHVQTKSMKRPVKMEVNFPTNEAENPFCTAEDATEQVEAIVESVNTTKLTEKSATAYVCILIQEISKCFELGLQSEDVQLSATEALDLIHSTAQKQAKVDKDDTPTLSEGKKEENEDLDESQQMDEEDSLLDTSTDYIALGIKEEAEKLLVKDVEEARQFLGDSAIKYNPDIKRVTMYIDTSFIHYDIIQAMGLFAVPVRVTFDFTAGYFVWTKEMTNNNSNNSDANLPPFQVDQIVDKVPNQTFPLQFQLKQMLTKFLKKEAGSSSNNSSNSKISSGKSQEQNLKSMGFASDLVTAALRFTDYSEDAALQLLLSQPDYLMEAAREMSKASRKDFKSDYEEDIVVPSNSRNLFIRLSSFLKLRISTCADYCPICDKKHGFGGFKPVVCENKECMWRYEELGLGLNVDNEIKTNPHVIDLLISVGIAALKTQDRRNDLWNPFPSDFMKYGTQNFDLLMKAMNAFPSVWEMALAENLKKYLATVEKQNRLDEGMLYRLLRFLLATNRTHLIKVPPSEQIKEMNTPHQYKLLSSTPEHEQKFQALKATYGSSFFFHGSPIHNWHSIMRNGLRNKMCRVPGIYMTNNSSISVGYMQMGSGSGWDKSTFGANISILGMVETILAKDSGSQINVNSISISHNDDYVVTRYFFVYANGTQPPGVDNKVLNSKYLNSY